MEVAFPSYRLPEVPDLIDDWAECFDATTLAPFYCAGEFFGRGPLAHAVFLIDRHDELFKVVVIPSSADREHELVSLHSSLGRPQNMFIRRVSPGRYKTLRGKGYRGASPGDPKVLRLHHDAVNAGCFESSDWISYWDKKKKQFRTTWMSD